MIRPMRDLNAHVSAKTGTVPLANTGTVVNGTGFDRTEFLSCVLIASAGAATGGPSAQTYDVKLQEADLLAGPYTDVADAATPQISADNGLATKGVDLGGLKKFVRTVSTVALTGGTDWPVSDTILLGGDRELPSDG